jgi:histidinol-phosphatase
VSTGVDLADELTLARRLADAADEISLPLFTRGNVAMEWKPNRTEVTDADRRAETVLGDMVASERSDHGFFGEEHGLRGDSTSPWRWIVDPIDGTSNFVRGIPVWATLIALTHVDLGAVVGMVSAPALGHRWWAARGLGAFVDGRQIRVSDVADIAAAQVSVTFSPGWDQLGLTDELVALQQRTYRARGFGDFWQHMLVAEGALDLAVDAVGLSEYDLAAVMVIVEEAGGMFTDRHGTATFRHDTAISSNGRLHHEAASLGGRPTA